MEGSKLHSVQLQLSLIQNEKERLIACLDSTIQRAHALSSQPSAMGPLMRDNSQLLLLLTEWADSAETHLANLYPGDVRPPTANGTRSCTSPDQSPNPLPGPAQCRTGGHQRAASPRPDPAGWPGGSAGSQVSGPSEPAGAADSVTSGRSARPPPAPLDGDTTLDSVMSFYTAAGAGGTAGTSLASARSLYHPDTATRRPCTPNQTSDQVRTPLLESPPPQVSKLNVSRKSSDEVSSIINRHLRKKKNTPDPPKEITQTPLPVGVETPVVLSCHDEATGYIYLNLKKHQDLLTRMTEELTALALHPVRVCRTPKQGELVMAVWHGAWYRARVIEVFDRGDASALVSLQYTDYGNRDQQSVEQVRFLPDKMKEAPAAAYKCKLVNLSAGGADHWPLQRRLLLALTECAECQLTALFRPSALPGLYEVTLVSVVAVAAEVVRADVAATLNRVLLLDAATAARQAASDVLELRPLLVPYRPAEPLVPAAAGGEQPADEKVRSWLAEQRRAGAGPTGSPAGRQPGPAGRQTGPAGRPSRQEGELDISFTTAVSRPARASRCHAPAEYSGLQLVWTARPVEQQLAGDGPHRVLMLQIYNPSHFYLGVRAELFDGFEARLSEVYGRLPLHPDQVVRHLLLPGSYWVARWQRDGAQPRWCRCVILEEQPPPAGQEAPPPPADYPVRWVDYGDTARLPPASFRPMTEEVAAEPLFAVRARYAGVYPVNELCEPVDSYPSDAADVFRDLLEDRVCLALPVPSESTPGCQAVLLEAMVDSALLSVTEALQDLGISALCRPELDPSLAEPERSEEAGEETDGSPVPAEQLDKWDPMSEDYVSPYNRPGEDPAAEVAGLAAREDPEEPAVCPVYARGGNCWDGVACRKRHVRAGDQLPATALVHSASREPLVLPRVGRTVYVKVSAVVSPQQFHVQLPFGAVPAEEVNADHAGYRRRMELEETLESLSAALSAAYGDGGQRRHYSCTHRPALGEVLVAPWQRGWHRGLVTDLTERLQPHRLSVEVFLVDHGVTVSCDAEELREIRQEFNLLPYQAVQCSLALVAPADGVRWSEAAVRRFVQLVRRPCLLATVSGRRPDGHLELDLFEGARRQLAQLLVQEGLAVWRRRQPSGQLRLG